MINNRIKSLFELIDFLYNNTENFKKYDSVITDIQNLRTEQATLNPKDNYKDKIKSKAIDNKIYSKIDIINTNITQPIKNKVVSLKVSDFSMQSNVWNWNMRDIIELKENPTQKDAELIKQYEQKYIHYRTKTKNDYYTLFFFTDLDRTLFELFSFFSDDNAKGFEQFTNETKKLEPQPQQKKKQKAGRKKTIIKDIREYLKFNYEESKETFINELKKLAYINDDEIEFTTTTHSKKIENVKKIFDDFYRENIARGGFGLGLKIVKDICDKNLVIINLDSNEKNTKFAYRFKINEDTIT